MPASIRRPQVSVLGIADPGSDAYERAGSAGALLAALGITVVSGCGSPATRFAAERTIAAAGIVLTIGPPDHMPSPDWPATVVVPCRMGDAAHVSGLARSLEAHGVLGVWADGCAFGAPILTI